MSIIRKIRRAIRGEVSPRTALLEGARRTQKATQRRGEPARLQQQAKESARLTPNFSDLSPNSLLEHFQTRTEPHFFPGLDRGPQSVVAPLHRLFPEDTAMLIASADRITDKHEWPLLGLLDHTFIGWHRDPLSGYEWPRDFYSDINLQRNDGSDVRFIWELNRLGHFLKLALAYSETGEQRYSAEFFRQLDIWEAENPFGYGVNWNCAMEVALRALNLLGAFAIFRNASDLDTSRLARLLRIFDRHGRFIREHLEFSYVATSNHYLSDVVGLLWLGIMLPELEDAQEWREFGLRELMREMTKQVLPDGADCESSTGYHRLVLELFGYSFLLCHLNAIEIEEQYWEKLRRMFGYLRAYLRPDGLAPLLGDSDSGQVFPLRRRSGNDHGYLLAIGALLFDDPQLKIDRLPIPPELLWFFGEQGVMKYEALTSDKKGPGSQLFPDAGVCVVRDSDRYLLFNASDAGLNGRGSHGHNDALSIEVSAGGCAFIVDPGTYVYTADLQQRHLFRSTAYHSTVEVDETEQNSTSKEMPFVIGNEAAPRMLECDLGPDIEVVTAEHYGYRRLTHPVTHRRRVVFNKTRRYWLVVDQLNGKGDHDLSFRFQFAPGLETNVSSDGVVELFAKTSGARLLIGTTKNIVQVQQPELEARFSSRDYGSKEASASARWSLRSVLPFALSFVIVPVSAGEDAAERLSLARSWEG
ncbi:MAG TPA: alginate lyase family protein [Pyrinomonadaceae bacterium]|nr:alginate lyase family protein [Pyrinomonadaceae bacterium]